MALFLITAPSGSGKTSILGRVKSFLGYSFFGECISHTTRPRRKGEIDEETYYFTSNEDFKDLMNNEHFAENVKYDNNRYGVAKSEIERVLKKYKNAYIIVERDGYEQIKNSYPDAIGIFMYMSKEDCMANMLLRGDKIGKAQDRISTYEKEMIGRHGYDYVIKNARGKQIQTTKIIANIVMQYQE